MATSALNTEWLDFDADGFLRNPRQWDAKVAEAIARMDGLERLTDVHWQVIGYLREHYLRHGTLPVMRHVCSTLHQDRHCVDTLFRSSREAWRVAGLPNPGEEAKTYM